MRRRSLCIVERRTRMSLTGKWRVWRPYDILRKRAEFIYYRDGVTVEYRAVRYVRGASLPSRSVNK